MTAAVDQTHVTFKVFEMDTILKDRDLHETARQLTLSPYGSSGMNMALNLYQTLINTRSVNAKGIFAYYDGKPVGWALVTRESDSMYFSPTVDTETCIQIYVHPDHRRRGIGSELIQRARSEAKSWNYSIIKVYAHNNYNFFAPFMGEFQAV